MKVPFSPPYIDEDMIAEVVATLRSGWITTGPKIREFEAQLAEYCGAQKVICLNSATAGLELMLRWYGVKVGDEVILPAYTYSATANVVMHCGAKPVFVDINPNDLNISVEAIAKAITPNTKAIMPVDIGGWLCDYDELMVLVNRSEVKAQFNPSTPEQKKLGRIMVLSDAAHSIGAEYKGKKTGILADATVFSFHAVKNVTTAEGGAVLLNMAEHFNEDDLYKSLKIKALHGQTKDAFEKSQAGNWRYDIVEAGYKWNMSDLQAALGIVQLKKYPKVLERRREVCEAYTNALSQYSWAELPTLQDDNKTSCCHLYPLLVRGISSEQRDEIIKGISERDVAVNVHFVPVPLLSFYANRGFNMDNSPVAMDKFTREISLPVFYDITDEQVEYVIQVVAEVVEKVMAAG